MQKSLLEIEEEYKRNIFIPEIKPARQIFFCPVGLVGAGKTTVTKPIAERLGLVRISNDELRKLLKENGYDYEPVGDILRHVANDYMLNGYSLAFDMDCGNSETKELIEKSAEKFEAKMFWVHVIAPEEYIFEKFRRHPPSWLASDPQIMIDNYLIQKERRMKENTEFDFMFTFDTSKPDIREQIEKCIDIIQNAA